MFSKNRSSQLALMAFLTLALCMGQAQATSKHKIKKTRTASAAGQTYINIKPGLRGSQESKAERSQRLKRECKGRPNSGACLGYAY